MAVLHPSPQQKGSEQADKATHDSQTVNEQDPMSWLDRKTWLTLKRPPKPQKNTGEISPLRQAIEEQERNPKNSEVFHRSGQKKPLFPERDADGKQPQHEDANAQPVVFDRLRGGD